MALPILAALVASKIGGAAAGGTAGAASGIGAIMGGGGIMGKLGGIAKIGGALGGKKKSENPPGWTDIDPRGLGGYN